MADDEKGFSGAWNRLKEDFTRVKAKGFNDSSANADKNIELNRQQYGNQLQEDMKLSPMERRVKAQKGFEGR